MASGTLLLTASLALLASLSHSAKFPSTWKKCPKTNNEDCLITAIQEVILDIKDGKKSVGAFPMDPLHITHVNVNQGGNNPVAINLTFHEIDLVGFSRVKLSKAKVDWDNYYMEFRGSVPGKPAAIVGGYEVEGKILILPIRGKGKANISFYDLDFVMKMNGSEMIKKGKKYFHVDDISFVSTPRMMHFRLDNLFNGMKELGENMNKFLNQNWKDVAESMKESMSESIGLSFKEISNNVLKRLPVDQLYLKEDL